MVTDQKRLERSRRRVVELAPFLGEPFDVLHGRRCRLIEEFFRASAHIAVAVMRARQDRQQCHADAGAAGADGGVQETQELVGVLHLIEDEIQVPKEDGLHDADQLFSFPRGQLRMPAGDVLKDAVM